MANNRSPLYTAICIVVMIVALLTGVMALTFAPKAQAENISNCAPEKVYVEVTRIVTSTPLPTQTPWLVCPMSTATATKTATSTNVGFFPTPTTQTDKRITPTLALPTALPTATHVTVLPSAVPTKKARCDNGIGNKGEGCSPNPNGQNYMQDETPSVDEVKPTKDNKKGK